VRRLRFVRRLNQTNLTHVYSGLVRSVFDEARLPAGDYLIAFKTGGTGMGSYPISNVGMFGHAVPERPLLDSLIPCNTYRTRDGAVHKIALPQWRFHAGDVRFTYDIDDF
jgi:hypothetical protein